MPVSDPFRALPVHYTSTMKRIPDKMLYGATLSAASSKVSLTPLAMTA